MGAVDAGCRAKWAANERPADVCHVEHLVGASLMYQHLFSPSSLPFCCHSIYLPDMHEVAALQYTDKTYTHTNTHLALAPISPEWFAEEELLLSTLLYSQVINYFPIT